MLSVVKGGLSSRAAPPEPDEPERSGGREPAAPAAAAEAQHLIS